MIKLLIGLLDYLRLCAPLLTSLAILALLCILLAKSIRKNSTIYYTVFAIPFLLVILPSMAGMLGIEVMSFVRVPFLGEIIRDYIHMGTFGHPLLIIIMYMGALNPKNRSVNRLLSIRKELSIISGFAVFAHSWIRVMNSVPGAYKYFVDREGYLATSKVASELGAGFSSFSFLLGVFMLIVFIPLWVTSFDSIRKRMRYAKWKKWQKWSYVLYATLFIHAMGIQIGGMLNPRGGAAPKPKVEVVATTGQAQGDQIKAVKPPGEGRGERPDAVKQAANSQPQSAKPASGGRMPTKGFADFEPSAQAKRYIHLFSLVLIYGSYLFLRLRKAKKDAKKRSKTASAKA